ncbi:hypothetical protein BDZ91DRAFT_848609 [Kalaharituber pfeilii]|nr:hypothetical protein BDZ91DRAFT_848609 [Kalaharituber pfeilii]
MKCSRKYKGKVICCAGGAALPRKERCYRPAHLVSAPGLIVLALAADIRPTTSLTSTIDNTLKKLGKIDFVIAGAARNFLAPVTTLSANVFKAVVDIDLIASYNTVKLPHIIATSFPLMPTARTDIQRKSASPQPCTSLAYPSKDTLKSTVPLQRKGDVKEIADTTVWLLSEAGDWSRGAVVAIDGDSRRTQNAGVSGDHEG